MKIEIQTFYEAAVRRVVERVTHSLDAALDLTTLAREAALSPFYFHRIFRGMVGETPLEMHRRLRLERAARDLLEGSDPVTSIAFADRPVFTARGRARALERDACHEPLSRRVSRDASGIYVYGELQRFTRFGHRSRVSQRRLGACSHSAFKNASR